MKRLIDVRLMLPVAVIAVISGTIGLSRVFAGGGDSYFPIFERYTSPNGQGTYAISINETGPNPQWMRQPVNSQGFPMGSPTLIGDACPTNPGQMTDYVRTTVREDWSKGTNPGEWIFKSSSPKYIGTIVGVLFNPGDGRYYHKFATQPNVSTTYAIWSCRSYWTTPPASPTPTATPSPTNTPTATATPTPTSIPCTGRSCNRPTQTATVTVKPPSTRR